MQAERSFWPTAAKWLKRVGMAVYVLTCLMCSILYNAHVPHSSFSNLLIRISVWGAALTPVMWCLWRLADRRARQTGFGAADVLLGLVLAEGVLCVVYIALGLPREGWLMSTLLPYYLIVLGLYAPPMLIPWPLTAVLSVAFAAAWCMKKHRERS